MRSLLLTSVVVLFAVSGCVVHEHGYYRDDGYRDTTPQQVMYSYSGSHPIPDAVGGGWCLIEGPHTHDYAPDYNYYAYSGGYYTYSGPTVVYYYDEHPIPGGGYCTIHGRHEHRYAPEAQYSSYYTYDRGNHYYVYRDPNPGGYHGATAVPAGGTYRPTPPPGQGTYQAPPSGSYYGNNRPPPPGQGSYVPPPSNHGGTPPPPPGNGGYTSPPPGNGGYNNPPPGHGGVPPGQGGTPPGQSGPPPGNNGNGNGYGNRPEVIVPPPSNHGAPPPPPQNTQPGYTRGNAVTPGYGGQQMNNPPPNPGNNGNGNGHWNDPGSRPDLPHKVELPPPPDRSFERPPHPPNPPPEDPHAQQGNPQNNGKKVQPGTQVQQAPQGARPMQRPGQMGAPPPPGGHGAGH